MRRIFLGFLYLVFFIYSFFSIIKFLKYPTAMEEHYQDGVVEFPDITVCYFPALGNDKLQNINNFIHLKNAIDETDNLISGVISKSVAFQNV